MCSTSFCKIRVVSFHFPRYSFCFEVHDVDFIVSIVMCFFWYFYVVFLGLFIQEFVACDIFVVFQTCRFNLSTVDEAYTTATFIIK